MITRGRRALSPWAKYNILHVYIRREGGMKSKTKVKVVWFCAILLIIGIVAFLFFQRTHEGIQNEDTGNFTGFMIFTKSSGCDKCRNINDVAVKLYKQFPNNVRVVDCVDFAEVSVLLTKFRVDEKDVPVILSFKDGIDTPYTSFTDYDHMEAYILDLMRTRPPITSTDRSVGAIKNSEDYN